MRGISFQLQAAHANNAAVVLHEGSQIEEAVLKYKVALNSLATASKMSVDRDPQTNHSVHPPPYRIAVGSISRPLPIDQKLVSDGACSLAHQTLITLYNSGLAFRRLPDGNHKAAAFFALTLASFKDSQLDFRPQDVDATFVVSLYCNAGKALFELEQDGAEEEALFMFAEAVRIGKEHLNNHVITIDVLYVIGGILASRGHSEDAMVVFMDAWTMFDRLTVAMVIEKQSLQYLRGAPAA